MDRSVQLQSTPVLMLSTGYEPLFHTTWKRALSAVLGGRAEVLETHETLTIGTSSGSLPFPIKVRFVTGVIARSIKNLNKHAQLSRKNLHARDKGKCQYCSKSVPLKTGTIDHVIPRSRGGLHLWENVVWSCSKCNQKKGAKLLSETFMKLNKTPKAPSISEMAFVRKS